MLWGNNREAVFRALGALAHFAEANFPITRTIRPPAWACLQQITPGLGGTLI